MMKLIRKLPPWLLLLLGVLYVLSPVDLLPDFLGLPGRFDDLLVALGTLLYLYSGSKKFPGTDSSGRARSSREGRGRGEDRTGFRDGSRTQGEPGSVDPYEVLGAARGDDLEEIRRRYKEMLLQYHPDRVQHLGKEFQEMAERKTKEINEAFRKIVKERGGRS